MTIPFDPTMNNSINRLLIKMHAIWYQKAIEILTRNLNYSIEELFFIGQSWGIQVLHYNNIILREYYINEEVIHCYFEENDLCVISFAEKSSLYRFAISQFREDNMDKDNVENV